MALMTGDKLGPYEILGPIGAGGMGEVYKARDTRLNRPVAIKTSKHQFSKRFEGEARAVAALNHPNICQLYDVGPDYLVMELVEGEPIAGPLPESKAVEYAVQILNALDAAHRKNIVHRDLKPANILVTKQGVKLLDFGLAKNTGGVLKQTDDTRTKGLTEHGEIVGTLQYMSPEQLQAKEADVRSDIFSFGCVLYELLTGRRAFNGASAASLIAAILEREPEPLQTTDTLARVVKRCLAKDPDDRFQSVRDLKYNLTLDSQPEPIAAKSRRWPILTLAAALPVAAIAGWLLKPPPEQPVLLVELALPDGFVFQPSARPYISPDGKRIAIWGRKGEERPSLWIRNLETGATVTVPDANNGANWTPDSRFLLFKRGERIYKTSLSTAPPVLVCDGCASMVDLDWQGNAYVVEKNHLHRLDPDGVTRHTVAPHVEVGRPPIAFLPDGKHFVFDFGSDAMLAALDGSPSRKLFRNSESPVRFTPGPKGGWLTYVEGDIAYARAIDLDTLTFAKEGIPIAGSIPAGLSASFSHNGIVAFRKSTAELSQLTWFDRAGNKVGTVGQPMAIANFDYHGKTEQLIVREDSPARDIYRIDPKIGSASRIARGTTPRFSHDGSRIYFRSVPNLDLVEDHPAGGHARTVLKRTSDSLPLSIAGTVPGEKWLVGRRAYISLDDPLHQIPFQAEAPDLSSRISPNGKWRAFSEANSSPPQLYIEAVPKAVNGYEAAAGRVTVGAFAGGAPTWRGDGKELFFVDFRRSAIMAAPVEETGGLPGIGLPKELFPWLARRGRAPDFGHTPDGQRFLFAIPVGAAPNPPISIIFNWPKYSSIVNEPHEPEVPSPR